MTILTGSFLLFLVQPMIARMALPRLGGAPAVWNSAMLVYQALLLGGYAYAHALSKLRPRQSAAVHLVVLALAALWLPIGLYNFDLPADAEPAVWVPWLLGASIGPLFFAVSAQAPLMQRWYAVAAPGRDPYALYAASNIGSFGGLIAYPLLVEPTMALDRQSLVWSVSYVALFVLVVACALRLPRRVGADAPIAAPSVQTPFRRALLWIALAFVPSGLMLATSTFLTTDIVAVPLLWVLPLGLYLLSFSVAFASRRGIAEAITRFSPITILLFGGVMIAGHHAMPYLNAGIALLLLFVVSAALHTRMYDLRPAPDRLTGFYLAMSVGGALGGVFSGLVAPVVFDWTYEYPLLVLAAGLLVPQAFLLPGIARVWTTDPRGMAIRIAVVTLIVAGLAIFAIDQTNAGNNDAENIVYLVLCVFGILLVGKRLPYMIALFGSLMLFGGWRALETTMEGQHRTRSYFGVYTIRNYDWERTLAHGTTLHGIQLTGTPERERYPTSYYVQGSGVGVALRMTPGLYGPNARVGAVGLGTGTLACYAKPGQRWTIFEIDPAVVAIARDPAKFTFLSRCLPQANIVLGDARMRLAQQASNSLDVLVLDAFSSDAIPMHLMTREAFETYGRVLQRKGLLLVHTSNRFLDLEPIVAASAKGWMGAMLHYSPHESEGEQATVSDWIVLTRDPSTFAMVISDGSAWRPLYPRRDLTPWTDDYATILPVLKEFR
ncbi:fused MFS/spermidine synthase [uncultured Sphingomonas sp.]|uniref:fused MFS/spermidine synthase n=1 Tax=uncultured Sphingomonas sp. TaxID=158754 RepID=UPI0025EAAC8D|nr:fused MFS/spermidine synthase [uncultured Sphingomonas sp.]